MTILTRENYFALLDQIPLWAGNYLEIGVYEGDMLRDYAQRWPAKNFYGIDPFISDFGTVGHTGLQDGEHMAAQRAASLANFKDVPNLKFFEQTSKSFNDEKTDAELAAMNVAIVYVDGAHSYEHTLNDLCLAERLICGRGLIYVDDYGLPEVIQATNEFIPMHKHRIESHAKRSIVLKP